MTPIKHSRDGSLDFGRTYAQDLADSLKFLKDGRFLGKVFSMHNMKNSGLEGFMEGLATLQSSPLLKYTPREREQVFNIVSNAATDDVKGLRSVLLGLQVFMNGKYDHSQIEAAYDKLLQLDPEQLSMGATAIYKLTQDASRTGEKIDLNTLRFTSANQTNIGTCDVYRATAETLEGNVVEGYLKEQEWNESDLEAKVIPGSSQFWTGFLYSPKIGTGDFLPYWHASGDGVDLEKVLDLIVSDADKLKVSCLDRKVMKRQKARLAETLRKKEGLKPNLDKELYQARFKSGAVTPLGMEKILMDDYEAVAEILNSNEKRQVCKDYNPKNIVRNADGSCAHVDGNKLVYEDSSAMFVDFLTHRSLGLDVAAVEDWKSKYLNKVGSDEKVFYALMFDRCARFAGNVNRQSDSPQNYGQLVHDLTMASHAISKLTEMDPDNIKLRRLNKQFKNEVELYQFNLAKVVSC
jgi:hypothetical protein